MDGATLGPKAATASELKAQLEAERAGSPFLVHRDAGGEQRIVSLGPGDRPVWVGRRAQADLCLSWDSEVSGIHAQLEPGGGGWTLVDDGLSRNGSYVNGPRTPSRPIRPRHSISCDARLRVVRLILLTADESSGPGHNASQGTITSFRCGPDR